MTQPPFSLWRHSHCDVILIATSFATELAMPTVMDVRYRHLTAFNIQMPYKQVRPMCSYHRSGSVYLVLFNALTLLVLPFFSGCSMMEHCCIDCTSPQNAIISLPPGWVDTDIGRLCIIDYPQPGGTSAPLTSSPVMWWWKQCTIDSLVMVVILFGICLRLEPEEVEPSLEYKKKPEAVEGNW